MTRQRQFCLECGAERHPNSRPGRCWACKVRQTRRRAAERHLQRLQALGYEVHTPIEELWDKARKIDVTNLSCGHRFQARCGNILNRLSRCGVCGPRLRIQAARAAYLRRHGRARKSRAVDGSPS